MTNTCPDDIDPEAAWRCTLFNVHHNNGTSNSTSMGLDFAGYDRPPSMCSHSLGRSPEGELSYDPEDGDGDSCATFEPYVTTTISAVENPYASSMKTFISISPAARLEAVALLNANGIKMIGRLVMQTILIPNHD